MAKRTGTQLKSDMDAATTALDTAIAAPTQANIDGAIVAFQAVDQNGRDSRFAVQRSGMAPAYARDVARLASEATSELRSIRSAGIGTAYDVAQGGAAQRSNLLSLLKRDLTGTVGMWARYRDQVTTD